MNTQMPQFNIRGIPANLVEHFWKLAEPYIKRALDHANGEFTPANIKSFCKDKVIQLWLINEGEKVIGACTTEIVNYPQKRYCRVVTLGGSKAKDWMGDLDIILCEWAKQQGCQGLEAYVRKGFVPVLASYGLKYKYAALVKDFTQEN